jgi:phosphoribosylaminoimidazole carboxylase (NCAIR synthetase)
LFDQERSELQSLLRQAEEQREVHRVDALKAKEEVLQLTSDLSQLHVKVAKYEEIKDDSKLVKDLKSMNAHQVPL